MGIALSWWNFFNQSLCLSIVWVWIFIQYCSIILIFFQSGLRMIFSHWVCHTLYLFEWIELIGCGCVLILVCDGLWASPQLIIVSLRPKWRQYFASLSHLLILRTSCGLRVFCIVIIGWLDASWAYALPMLLSFCIDTHERLPPSILTLAITRLVAKLIVAN